MPSDATNSDYNSASVGRGIRAANDSQISMSTAADYQQALEYLFARINYEKIGHAAYTAGNYRLDRMRSLLDLLGNPQRGYPIIHIAGTKGKGTTSELISDCLTACGFRAGLYTSPHLTRLEERIRLRGVPCTAQDLVSLTARVREAAERLEMAGGGRATFFELTTAMGFLYFAEVQADCVVLEVGLGGRLDSTNVCEPVVTIITSISLDHQVQLGNTLGEIAWEKAGIIKPQVPLVCGARAPEAREVIVARAAEMRAQVRLIERDFFVDWRPLEGPFSTGRMRAEVVFRSRDDATSQLGETAWQTSLLGRHQADNIGCALQTLDILLAQGWKLPVEQLRQTLSKSHPMARLQQVGQEPVCIVDTAHNPASIEAGLQALDDHFPGYSLITVFATSRDKDYRLMLRSLMGSARHIVLTAYRDNPRGLPVDELASAAKAVLAELRSDGLEQIGDCPGITVCDSPQAAWERAKSMAGSKDLVLATGSFFLAAELLPLIAE